MDRGEAWTVGKGFVADDSSYEEGVTSDSMDSLDFHLPYTLSEGRNGKVEGGRWFCAEWKLLPID